MSFPAAATMMEGVEMGDGGGLRQYYVTKIEELLLTLSEKNQNLRRLQAQRNELNAKVRVISIYIRDYDSTLYIIDLIPC